ncbi:MAG: FtsW/RodA/SpoVE family cell cycle protein, partial [Ardenticatenaceae bacterium]
LTTWYLTRQLTWAGIGVVAMLVLWLVDYRLWKRLSTPIMGLTLLVLIAMFFIGKSSFGAARWLVEGGSVQPSEAAKLSVIIYVAHWSSSKGDRIRNVEVGLIPFAIMVGGVCGLILMQPSFSTALLVGVVATTMFFIAGADLKQLIITGAAAGGVAYMIARSAAYRMERFIVWRDPWALETGQGYQTTQVLYSLARGGLFGEGLGSSRGNVLALPAAHTDAILAILAQELGLVACLIVLALFLLLAHRGFRVAATAPDAFGTVLASGITCWLLYQALFNVAVITNTIPPTGIPMPFISFGGSGLVTALAGIGILLNISKAQPRDNVER